MPSTEPLIFTDADAARAALEVLRWPDGPVCPRCGSSRVTRIVGRKQSHRAGLLSCKACRSQLTVTVGTCFERSKVPLNLWLHVIHLENSYARQLTPWGIAQLTGLTYKTIEKMRMRIYAAVNTYDGPNTIFGRNVTAYIRDRRRKKNPLGIIAADGSLRRAARAAAKLDSTERLVRLLLRTPKPPKKRRRSAPSRKAA